MRLTELPTPSVLVDRARVVRNVERMQSAADARHIRLRPHAKTHKIPAFAKMQIARGAVGICCAKLGEAEVFANAGIEDIRLPYPLNPVNADRLLRLSERAKISFIVDHAEVARGWSKALEGTGDRVGVLVKVDVGLHRCGIDPDAAGAAEFVARVAELPGLRFRGLLSHAGHAYGAMSDAETESMAAAEARLLTTLAAQVKELGVPVEEISVGATPTSRFSLHQPGITELRPGNYIYYDRTQVALGAASYDDCALTVLARVVGRPASDRLILDCGSKTLSNDLARGAGNTAGHGAVMQAIDATAADDSIVIERLSEEHAVARVKSECALQPGDLVRVVPNHSCVVSNLVDAIWVVEGDEVGEQVPVAARGRIT